MQLTSHLLVTAFLLDSTPEKSLRTLELLNTPVLYPVGLIEDKEASDDDTAAAEAFLEYIKSDDAMKVFEKYGFSAYKAADADAAEEEDAEATEEADDTEADTETTEEAK